MINIFHDDDDWCVWLDTEEMERDGVCIGVGKSPISALKQGEEYLKMELKEVQRRIESPDLS